MTIKKMQTLGGRLRNWDLPELVADSETTEGELDQILKVTEASDIGWICFRLVDLIQATEDEYIYLPGTSADLVVWLAIKQMVTGR